MISGFLRELKRRRVLNTASLYVVGAWVALQVVDLLSEAGLPPSTTRNLLFLLTIGFVPVLVFGWFFDVSVKGITRTQAANPDMSLPELEFIDHLLLAGLIIVMLGDAYTLSFLPPETELNERAVVASNTAPTIAVLPFTYCIDDELEEALASGIADEVLRRLAGVDEIRVAAPEKLLKVTARTSSFLFGGSDLDTESVADSLGVNYLLKGKACRQEDLLTISVNLIDQDTNLVWSGDFEEIVNSSGQVNITLAESIANAVAGELGPEQVIPAPLPVDRIAYENLLIGRGFGLQGQFAEAREALQRAVERKPDYPEAIYELALLELAELGGDLREGMQIALREAEYALAIARRELQLNPESAHSHYIVGRMLAAITTWDRDLAWRVGEEQDLDRWGEQSSEAEQHFRKAIAMDPSLSDAYYRLGKILEARGAGVEALELYELGLVQARDPFNLDLNVAIARQYAARDRFREAIDLLDRFKSLPIPVPIVVWRWQLHFLTVQSYFDEKCELLIDMLLNDPEAFDAPAVRFQAWWFISQLQWLQMDEEATAWMERLKDMPGLDQLMRDIVLDNYQDSTKEDKERLKKRRQELEAESDETIFSMWNETAHWRAVDLAIAGEINRAIRLLEAIQYSQSFYIERQVWPSLSLIKLYQHAGRNNDAQHILEGVVTYLETEVASGIRQPDILESLSQAYALQGRDDKAIETFRMAVDFHFYFDSIEIFNSSEEWLLQPAYARLKDDPRMVDQRARIQAYLDEQKRNIKAMLAPHDLDALLAPLMTIKEVPERISHGHDKE